MSALPGRHVGWSRDRDVAGVPPCPRMAGTAIPRGDGSAIVVRGSGRDHDARPPLLHHRSGLRHKGRWWWRTGPGNEVVNRCPASIALTSRQAGRRKAIPLPVEEVSGDQPGWDRGTSSPWRSITRYGARVPHFPRRETRDVRLERHRTSGIRRWLSIGVEVTAGGHIAVCPYMSPADHTIPANTNTVPKPTCNQQPLNPLAKT